MRYFFRVEYDGTNYGGWQRQKNAVSVQSRIEEVFSTVSRFPCTVTGAGRTDAGVHARGQGAHVDLPAALSRLSQVSISVNSLLPHDIAIYDLQEAPSDLHARFSAKRRTYKYSITTRKRPLLHNRAWGVWYRVDWDNVRANLPLLIGTHDFSAFCAANTTTTNMTCTIHEATLTVDDDLYVFTIQADRYIYKMVRSLIGTLIDIGRGRISMSIDRIIAERDRRLVGTTAPAWGLVLDRVEYPGGI